MYYISPESEYNRLRSRMFNLYHTPKRVTRQVMALLEDFERCSPDSREKALRDGVSLHLHLRLPRLVYLRTIHGRDSAAMAALRTVFGSHFTEPLS